MKYITSLIHAVITIPQSLFNVIICFLGRSDLWVNWDMDWLVFLEVRKLKEDLARKENEKLEKLKKAEIDIAKAKNNG